MVKWRKGPRGGLFYIHPSGRKVYARQRRGENGAYEVDDDEVEALSAYEADKMVYDTVTVSSQRIDDGSCGPSKCLPLTVEDLYKARPPVVVVLAPNPPGRKARKSAGMSNEIIPVTLCKPCVAPRVVWRHHLHDRVFEEQDILMAVSHGSLGIGPAVYAVTPDSMYIEKFSSDMHTFLEGFVGAGREDGEVLFKGIMTVLARLAHRGVFCTDMKPANAVVRLDAYKSITDVRLIDFDHDSCGFSHHALSPEVLLFVMTFHFYLHVLHMETISAARTRVMELMRSTLLSSLLKLKQKQSELEVALEKNREDFIHYFDRAYSAVDVVKTLAETT